MFDQKAAVERWRARLAETGSLFEADLDELESHLHDHLESLEEVGITGGDAFQTATRRLGDTRSLADEFAKVNPLLAWRAALFWITAGVLLVFGLRPVQELSEHAVIASCMALRLGKTAVSIAVWALAFASPLVFFAVLFPLARRRIESPLPWARSPVFRVGLLVGCALLMLASHLLLDWGFLYAFEKRWSVPALLAAYDAVGNASYALAVAAPIFLVVVAVRQRALAMKNRAAAAPLFWLAVGIFVGAVRCELHLFVREAAMACASVAKLGPAQMNALMWIVTLGCPLVLFASTYGYLRHGAPGPSRVLRAPFVLVVMAASGAMAIAAVFLTNPIASSARIPSAVALAAWNAWFLAGIVTSCALPVIVGGLMLRTLRAGTLALRVD
ncbi:MAG: hypothetical protein JWO86_653 [Myxococcaceae bacterium]|nr:hypothetical protein [Myxococcaceae bacterium]